MLAPDDAVVRVEASGICGSDLHIYHGRVQIEPGFVIGHEFVGEVVAAGDDVSRVSVGDRVLGTYGTACGECFFCRREEFHKCDEARVFGHGKTLGSLQGAQAELLLVPHANLTLRRVPHGMSDDVALFAGDVMGTGYHAVDQANIRPGDTAAVLGLGPVGLCAVQAAKAAGAAHVVAIDTVEDRLRMAESFGATPVHLTEQDPRAPRSSAPPRAAASTWRRCGRPSRRARPGLPAGAQGRHRLGDRRLRRAGRGPHGDPLDQGNDREDGSRERDQARGPRPRRPVKWGSSTRARSSPTT